MSSSKKILDVQNLNLVFKQDFYKSSSLRDTFTNLTKDPWSVFSKNRDRLHILKNISFSVNKGDRVGLIGINGAGKTSLCRCIAGIYHPNSGRAIIDGSCRAIFETFAGINQELTGRENAELLSWLLFPHLKNRAQLVDEAMDFSELGHFLNTPFKYYSKGMQTRLCLSLVTSFPCELLILDEVFDGADQFFSQKISARVLGLIEQSGAVIFVSHTAEQIRRVCNKVIILKDGEVFFNGEVEKGLQVYGQQK